MERKFYSQIVAKKLNTIADSALARTLILACDTVVLCLCYYVVHMLVRGVFPTANPGTDLLLLWVAHLCVALCLPPILMRQESTGAQIVCRSLKTALAHFFVSAGCYAIAQRWMGGPEWLLTFWGGFAALLTLERLFLRTLVKKPETLPLCHWPYIILKRAMDVVVSLVFLTTLFPFVYLVVAFYIKRQNPGPVFCKKTFEGRGGKKCRGLCFRTTATDADGQRRLLPIGEVLQRRHWNELPLFFKILGGSMSLAGPRYHAVADMEAYHQQTDEYQVCRLVKPGLSGCAGSKTVDTPLQDDIAYLRNWSLWLDIKLILRMCGKSFNI